MSDNNESQPNVEPSYRILDDRAEDPDAFARDPSAEASHVPRSMTEEWGDQW